MSIRFLLYVYQAWCLVLVTRLFSCERWDIFFWIGFTFFGNSENYGGNRQDKTGRDRAAGINYGGGEFGI